MPTHLEAILAKVSRFEMLPGDRPGHHVIRLVLTQKQMILKEQKEALQSYIQVHLPEGAQTAVFALDGFQTIGINIRNTDEEQVQNLLNQLKTFAKKPGP